MKFLRWFFNFLAKWRSNSPITVPKSELAGDAPLARYIFSKRHFNPKKNEVAKGAFMPPPDLELSVFYIGDLSESHVWQLGTNIPKEADSKERTLHARADILTKVVRAKKLTVTLDNDPLRHTTVSGWP